MNNSNNDFYFLRFSSKKCLDSDGNQLIFAVKKGTDSPLFWKVTVRIACVKINSNSKQIVNYKLLNLKQFLQVFKTFETHLQVMLSSEKQRVRYILCFIIIYI